MQLLALPYQDLHYTRATLTDLIKKSTNGAVVLAHGHPGPYHPNRQGGFPPPNPPGLALLRSLQAEAAWVRWRGEDWLPSPYFPLVQGQALLHAEDMGIVESGAIVPDTACRWITAAGPQPMRSPPACHCLLRLVLPSNSLPRPHTGSVKGHAEGVDRDLGRTVPAGTSTRAAHSSHARGPPRPAQGVRPYAAGHR